MKPNLKTPGGFVVLVYDPTIAGGEAPITFEAYKAKTGIDLHKIFIKGDNGYPVFNHECKKPIYISQNHDIAVQAVSPILATYTSSDNHELWLVLTLGLGDNLTLAPYLYIKIIQDGDNMLIQCLEN